MVTGSRRCIVSESVQGCRLISDTEVDEMFRKLQKGFEDRRLVPDRRWCSDRRIAEVPIKEVPLQVVGRWGDRRRHSIRRRSEI